MSDSPVTAAEAPAAAPAPTEAPKAPVQTPSRAAAALAAYRAKAVKPAAAATPDAPRDTPAIPSDVAEAARRWAAHVKSEAARINALAATLSDDDKSILEAVSDLGARARLLERLKASLPSEPVKEKAKPRAAGGPPAASVVDFTSALKDPQAMADAKARDPQGLKAFLSRAMNGTASRSTLDRGRA